MRKTSVRDAAWDLIYEYYLHFDGDIEHEYVPLERLAPVFPIMLKDMADADIEGFVVPPDEPITRWNPCPIVLSAALEPAYQRIAYAHEIGHALMGHKGTYTRNEQPGAGDSPEEREAWFLAATILVPVAAIFNYMEVEKIAEVCEVPVWLVELIR